MNTSNILTTDADVVISLKEIQRIAVLGIKPESHANQPAYYVPKYMQNAGYSIVPVPVYYPEITEIMGEKVFRDLRDVPGTIDMVNVFRRPQDIAKHTEEILSVKPKLVWFQSGIRNDDAARRFADAGIFVVQDRCLMVEHRHLLT